MGSLKQSVSSNFKYVIRASHRLQLHLSALLVLIFSTPCIFANGINIDDRPIANSLTSKKSLISEGTFKSEQSLKGEKTLKIAYIEFPPVTFSNTRGQPDGYIMEILTQVAKDAGFHFSVRPYPTKRLIQNMINGDADLFVGVSSLIQLKEHIIVGSETITNIYFRSYYFGDFGPISKKQDLRGKRVIIMRGYSYNGWANYIKNPKNNIEYFEADSHSQGLDALKSGRGDVLLDYQGPAALALKETDITNLKQGNAFSQPLYFVVSKKTPNAEQVAKRLDETFARLKKGEHFKGLTVPIH